MNGKGSQGASHYIAPNPDFGASITYYLPKNITSLKQKRKQREKELLKTKKQIKIFNWQKIEKEIRQEEPKVILTITDSEGNVVRRLDGKNTKGFHRIAWNLRYAPSNAITFKSKKNIDDFRVPKGRLAIPGTYYVSLSKEENGTISSLAEKVPIEVVKMRDGALPTDDITNISKFWEETAGIQRKVSAINIVMKNIDKKLQVLKKSINNSPTLPGRFDKKLHSIREKYVNLDIKLNGSKAKLEVGEKFKAPTINNRLMTVVMGISQSTYGPTQTHRESLKQIKNELRSFLEEVTKLKNNDIPEFEKEILKSGAPWVEGMSIIE
jgi:hypothetical protein